MKVWLAGVVATGVTALAVCGAASAAPSIPAGFKLSAKLSAPASFVARKPVSVYCAPNRASMNVLVGPNAVDTEGYTPIINGNIVYLANQVCGFLDAWLLGKNPSNFYGMVGSLQTIAHESEHARGVRDETDADCAALRDMVPMIRRYFPLRKRTTMHQLMGEAWQFHYDGGPAYNERPC